MSVYAIGDIHGCYEALQALVRFVPVLPDDLVIALGDYVDRGPQSSEVVDWIRQRTERGRCIPLRGNHEVMMMDAINGRSPVQFWWQFGGRETLDSYAFPGRKGSLEDIPMEHLRFFDLQLLPYYETEDQIFVHGSLDADMPLNFQSDQSLYWDRFSSLHPHQSGKVVICGHTAQKSGLPADRGFGVCIDTWACGRGWLTCLDVDTGQFWQANQKGETRTDALSTPLRDRTRMS